MAHTKKTSAKKRATKKAQPCPIHNEPMLRDGDGWRCISCTVAAAIPSFGLAERFEACTTLLAETMGRVRTLESHVKRLELIVAVHVLGVNANAPFGSALAMRTLDAVGGPIR